LSIQIVGMIAGAINGLFGSGAGMIILPALCSIFDMEDKKSRGTTIMSILFLTIISSIFYLKNTTDLQLIWYVSVGGVVGGIIGAKLVNIVPPKYLKMILGIFMIITGIKMIV